MPLVASAMALLLSISLLQLIEDRLGDHSPDRKRLRRFRKRAAVAMILQVREGELHILMIKRAERDGDRWSGQMAFPGGRMEPEDANGYETARRETLEETGLDLGPRDSCVGRLSEISARPNWGALGMIVTPFVYRLHREVTFEPNEEVDEVVWVPLEFLLDTDNRVEMTWSYRGLSMTVPCYHFGKRTIWGLSLMMLDELMDLVEGQNPARQLYRRR